MAKGLSLHVGVNEPHPSFGMAKLDGCVKDAEAMEQIAIEHNFTSLGVFRDGEAKFEVVKEEILKAARDLDDGDIFFFTFAGHGSTHPTVLSDEDDGHDETILLHNCILIDNYVRRVLWSKFEKGVRILAVADCCHSGSSFFAFFFNSAARFLGSFASLVSKSFTSGKAVGNLAPGMQSHNLGNGAASGPKVREFTFDDRERILEKAPDIHATIAEELLSEGKEPEATILTLAACSDDEKALDFPDHGAFTKAMLAVLKSQNPPGNYDELMSRITQNLADNNIKKQHPTRFPHTIPESFLAKPLFDI